MDTIFARCCGMDVHSKTIKATIRCMNKNGNVHEETRTYGTMTHEILALSDWLMDQKVTHVAMESTGIYWKPIYNIMEGSFTIFLVNAKHVKNVPGRKTDVSDSQWIAQLLQCGLLKGSYIPERPQREFRDLTRHRMQLVKEKTSVANRIHKVLEDANIKLGNVATDILGKSGRDMIRALIEGHETPEEMAELARRQLRGKIPQLRLALTGRVTAHHRFMLKEHMEHLEYLENQIDRFSEKIEEISRPFAEAMERVAQLPGFDKHSAEAVIAEIGSNMDQFSTAHHLCSWAGMCPGNQESAGKRKSGKTTKGSKSLRATLVQSAWAASRTKDSYFQAQYRRLVSRRGKKRALVAVGHSLLIVIYHMLKNNLDYHEIGAQYFDRLNSKRLVPYLKKRLENLGYEVLLTTREAAA